MERTWWRRVAWALVVFEGVSNGVVFCPLVVAFPRWTLAQFAVESEEELQEIAVEAWRWFGTMAFGMSGVGLARAMLARCETTERVFLETHLATDVLYVGATALWASRLGNWTLAVVLNVVYGVLLFFCRLVRLHELAVLARPKQA